MDVMVVASRSHRSRTVSTRGPRRVLEDDGGSHGSLRQTGQASRRVEFPPQLKDRIHFDPVAHKLIFHGYMSKTDFDRLCQLSNDWAFRRTLEELFRLSIPEDKTRPKGVRRWLAAVTGYSRWDQRLAEIGWLGSVWGPSTWWCRGCEALVVGGVQVWQGEGEQPRRQEESSGGEQGHFAKSYPNRRFPGWRLLVLNPQIGDCRSNESKI